eukprot:CAMPEP_0205802692 /NCGR_PEP_ID=MMETSP0205-20121125/5110_1 /ASSEMBLY_ACC=CAM_ASM_000278 /TAXON_ID=36767 /ORGANISM="Euplotes focardii, Strain TN1" /LENGTH=152 /DNA_ID=CAMNT_0053069553 /DNA_START=370 /DNA_END=825 /DNA_ORIENTATION=-
MKKAIKLKNTAEILARIRQSSQIKENCDIVSIKGLMRKAIEYRNCEYLNEQKLITKLNKTFDDIEEDNEIIKRETDNIKGAIEYYKISKDTSSQKNKSGDLSQILDIDQLARMNRLFESEGKDDQFYMKDIIGYDGDFNIKCRSWMIQYLQN